LQYFQKVAVLEKFATELLQFLPSICAANLSNIK